MHMQATLEKKIKELQVRMVDLETKAYQSSPRPATGSRRMESRIEELTTQLSQSSRDKTETVRMQRSADKNARDAKLQQMESDRQRSRLEEEVRSYEAKIVSMRQAMDDLVSFIKQGVMNDIDTLRRRRKVAKISSHAGVQRGMQPISSRRR
jgi:myosin protein heavy chain